MEGHRLSVLNLASMGTAVVEPISVTCSSVQRRAVAGSGTACLVQVENLERLELHVAQVEILEVLELHVVQVETLEVQAQRLAVLSIVVRLQGVRCG